MSNKDYLNLSSDLRRIASWLQKGNTVLADDFIALSLKKFGDDDKKVENIKLSRWLTRVAEYKTRDWRSAEDALTLSVLLKNRFGPIVA